MNAAMTHLPVRVASAECAPACRLRHRHLAPIASECVRMLELSRQRRDHEAERLPFLQVHCTQRALGERAFRRATGQSLPAIVNVRPPEAEAFALVLLEVFPDDSPGGALQWFAGGYLWADGGVPDAEWRVVELDQVQFDEPFGCRAPRRVHAWFARLRKFLRARQAPRAARRGAQEAPSLQDEATDMTRRPAMPAARLVVPLRTVCPASM
jgi:hypothetical protein